MHVSYMNVTPESSHEALQLASLASTSVRGNRKDASKHSQGRGSPHPPSSQHPLLSRLNRGLQPPASPYLCTSLLGDVLPLGRKPVLFAEPGRVEGAGPGLLRANTGARPVASCTPASPVSFANLAASFEASVPIMLFTGALSMGSVPAVTAGELCVPSGGCEPGLPAGQAFAAMPSSSVVPPWRCGCSFPSDATVFKGLVLLPTFTPLAPAR